MTFEEVLFLRGGPRPQLILTIHDVPEDVKRQNPHRSTITWTYEPNPNGFPTGKELTAVQNIEEKLMAALAPSGTFFVGHVYEAGRMISTFHGPVPVPSTIKVKTGLFKHETLEVTHHLDPDWYYYTSTLEANPVEYQLFRSRQLLDTLAQHGDNHERSRPVDFGVSFPTVEARTAAIAEAEAAGYKVNETTEEEWIFVELQKETSLDRSSLGSTLDELLRIVERHGGEFDGWACPVTK